MPFEYLNLTDEPVLVFQSKKTLQLEQMPSFLFPHKCNTEDWHSYRKVLVMENANQASVSRCYCTAHH